MNSRKKYHRNRGQRLKLEAINRLGGCRCAFCGNDKFIFLTIDHKSKNGGQHRKEIGNDLHYWVSTASEEELKKWDLQVLCYNCNMSRRFHSDEEILKVLKYGTEVSKNLTSSRNMEYK